jgi:hypothetical protein
MDQVLSLRPFVPARDFAVSKRFYQAVGFRLSLDGEDVASLKLGDAASSCRTSTTRRWLRT